jgi:hypothetical protein
MAAPEGVEGGYFALRVLLARGLALAAETLARKGAAHSNSALMHRALAPIVARFTAFISQKLALQGVAVLGAIGGAAVNLAFIEQYHGLARSHFTMRRLERGYGAEAVRVEYGRLKAAAVQQPGQTVGEIVPLGLPGAWRSRTKAARLRATIRAVTAALATA